VVIYTLNKCSYFVRRVCGPPPQTFLKNVALRRKAFAWFISEITVYGVLHNDRYDTQLTCSHLNRNLFYRRRGTVCVTNVSDFWCIRGLGFY